MKLKKAIFLSVTLLCVYYSAYAEKSVLPVIRFDISQTVSKLPLADDVSADDAIIALKSKAIELNMKFVAHQPLSKELKARGIKSGRLEIFQFCNPEDAHKMVKFNPIFAAYMPCRIALVEDENGKVWLMMINLDMLINNTDLPPKLKTIAMRINKTLAQIMQAGASGDF
ncbi:hypothetical protein MNBD_GAMMA24-1599 [hydrothermal vent metagenome]|uniref:DUF302 domain-containing protein n=1 Tax=hydrothermal vent metagenome TaxID=652676 RepID=A0A3B1CCR0_9ZZZZ